MKKILYILGAAIWLSGCIEPYEVDIPDSSQILVVNGMITDKAETYAIDLTWSSPVDGEGFDKVSNATVSVESRDGETYLFQSAGGGRYLSDAANFQGEAGKEYRLLIDLPGANYASEWILLRESPPIESLYAEYDERVNSEGPVEGMQVFLNTGDPSGETRYYRWEWVETWRYQAQFAALVNYLGFDQLEEKESFSTCYHVDSSRVIKVATTAQNIEDRLNGYPLLYIDTETNKLASRYSILVRQYVMSEEEFFFWKTIQESIENVGSLFDRQPQSRTGNVHNINDETEPVLGYFSATSVAEKRLYIDRNDLPERTVVYTKFRECYRGLDTVFKADYIGQEEVDEAVFREISYGKVFYNIFGFPIISGYILTSPECSDCRELGGTSIKPDFWED